MRSLRLIVPTRPDTDRAYSRCSASWQHHKEATVVKNLTAADIQNLQPSDPDLACSICSKLLKEAVKTPCCGSSFCDTCIRPHLKENHNVCPECESKVTGGAKGLVVDEDRRQRSQDYIDDLVRASKEAAGTGSSEDGKDEAEKEADPASSPKPGSEPGEASVSGDKAASEPAGPAEDDLYKLAAPAPEMEPKPSNDGSVSASRPSAEPEPGRASTSPLPGVNGLPPMPMPPMMMNSGGGMMMGPGGVNNLAMLQQQFMHHSMMLQNPALPPPMRAQLMMARQHVNNQIILIQQQQMAAAQQQNRQGAPPQFARGGAGGRGGRGGRGGGRGGNSNRFNLSDFQARLQEQQANQGPALHQHNNVRRPPTGPKRAREGDAIELTSGDVDDGPPGKVSRQD